MATIKGVEDNFAELTKIDEVLIGNGSFKLHDNTVDYATPGIELTGALNCGIYHTSPLKYINGQNTVTYFGVILF